MEVLRETTSKNVLKIAQVEMALMLEKATSTRLQQSLKETRENLSNSEAALAAAVAANDQVRER